MNWTPEQYENFKQKQLSKRLEFSELKRDAKRIESTKKRLLIKEELLDKKRAAQIEAEKVKMETRAITKSQIRKQNPEYRIQADFVKLMNARRPEILVFSDTAAHIKKTMFQQKRANALSSPREKWPDVFVAQPSGDYAGFWIEFKAKTPFQKNGKTLLKNDHIEAQAATMQRLRSKGYRCEFAWDAVEAFRMVEDYLNL